MPIDAEEVLSDGEAYGKALDAAKKNGTGKGRSSGEGDWSKLWQSHPEGGGAFGGRDNALTKLVGFFRAKQIPYDASLQLAHSWNEQHCDPPLSPGDVHEKVGRKWHEWEEGNWQDLTPADLKPKKEEPKSLRFQTSDELLDMAVTGGGIEWIVPNVFARGSVHFISAPAAGSKTFILIDLARCVASGLPWFGILPVLQGAVLYIDEEMGERKMASRVRKLDVARGLPIYYLGKEGIVISHPDHRKQIVEFCKEKSVRLIIIDTLTGVHPGLKENEAEHVSKLRTYFADLVADDCALVVAHHDRKGGRGEGAAAEHERMAGSRDFAAMADMAYAIDKKGSQFHLGVSKNRLLADDEVLSLDYELLDNEDRSKVSVVVLDAEARRERVSSLTKMKIIESVRRDGEQTTEQLSKSCAIRKDSITEAVKNMVESGELTSRKEGRSTVYLMTAETPF